MKARELAQVFTTFIEEGTTPKGVKIKAFFNQLSASEKRLVANNISKAYAAHLEEEKVKSELREKKKKEISDLKKRAKALGMTLVENQ